eukprot:scaffold8086_cov86-Cylindrotheca_fusiformis.AAC.1
MAYMESDRPGPYAGGSMICSSRAAAGGGLSSEDDVRMTTTIIASAVCLGMDDDNETFPHRENSLVVNSHQSTTLTGRFSIVENSDLLMGFSQQQGCGQSTYS